MRIWLINEIITVNEEIQKKLTALVSAIDYSENSAIFEFCARNKFKLKSVNYINGNFIESFEITSGNKFEIKITEIIENLEKLKR